MKIWLKSPKIYARLYAQILVKFSVRGPHTPTPAPIGVKFAVEESTGIKLIELEGSI